MDTKEGTGRPVPKLTRENMDKKRKRVQRAPTKSLRSGHKDAGSKSMPKLVAHKPGQLERNAVAPHMAQQQCEQVQGHCVWSDKKSFVLRLKMLVPVAAANDPNIGLVKRCKQLQSVTVLARPWPPTVL